MSERAEFEAFCERVAPGLDLTPDEGELGGYVFPDTHCAWLAWQAARSTPKQGEAEVVRLARKWYGTGSGKDDVAQELALAVLRLNTATPSPSVEPPPPVVKESLTTEPPQQVEPVCWAIFDSQGFYEARDNEDGARMFCDHYNERPVDPLKPYTCAPLYAAPKEPKP